MTDQYWVFNSQLCKCEVQQAGLNFYRCRFVIWPFAVTVTGTIESDGQRACGDWPIKLGPVLMRTGIAVDQNYRAAGAFHDKMEARVFDGNEFRNSLRMMVRNAGSDVSLFESSGDVHAFFYAPN